MSQHRSLNTVEAVRVACQDLLKTQIGIIEILTALFAAGGRCYLVGGAVRDLFLSVPIHDLDIEVHNLSIDELAEILKRFGPVSLVGKAFGVLKGIHRDVDWSLPRTDTGGRKPAVSSDPFMGIDAALARRDLTMNALAVNLKSFDLIDPYHGLEDLSAGRLRSPDIRFFVEDPLRFYRVMSFISRFDMLPDAELNEMCTRMAIGKISIERIEAEFEKMILKSCSPSLGLRWLKQIGRLHEILPELAETAGVPQSKKYHPEGDVLEHSFQSADAAARLQYETDFEALVVVFAALTHDLGKISTTEFLVGDWRSYSHAEAGVPLARALLKRITTKKGVIDAVAQLVKYHMAPLGLVKQGAKLAAYKRLAVKLKGRASIALLAQLARADRLGRNPDGHEPLDHPLPEVDEFVKKAAEADALQKPEEPVVKGRDIMHLVPQGKFMGELLDYAYEEQLSTGIKDKKVLIAMIREKLKP